MVSYVAYFMTIYFITNAMVITILWLVPLYTLIQSSATAPVSDYTSTSDRGKSPGLLESAISLDGELGSLAGGLIADSVELRTVIFFSRDRSSLFDVVTAVLEGGVYNVLLLGYFVDEPVLVSEIYQPVIPLQLPPFQENVELARLPKC